GSQLSARELAHAVLGDVRTTSPFAEIAPGFQAELRQQFDATRERLTLERPRDPDSGQLAAPLMRRHRLMLRIQVPQDARYQLGAGVWARLQPRLSEDAHEDVRELIDAAVADTGPEAEFGQLLRLLDSESLGQLKKAAIFVYLDALGDQLVEVGD